MNPKPLSRNSTYFDFAVLMAAGAAFTLFVAWVLTALNIPLPFAQKQILGIIPMLLGLAKWGSDRLLAVWRVVQSNSQLLEQLKEKQAANEEVIKTLQKDNLWGKVQIENLYAQIEAIKENL
jgi:hypothetical protein